MVSEHSAGSLEKHVFGCEGQFQPQSSICSSELEKKYAVESVFLPYISNFLDIFLHVALATYPQYKSNFRPLIFMAVSVVDFGINLPSGSLTTPISLEPTLLVQIIQTINFKTILVIMDFCHLTSVSGNQY